MYIDVRDFTKVTSLAVSSTVSKTFILFSYTSSFLCSGGVIGGASLNDVSIVFEQITFSLTLGSWPWCPPPPPPLQSGRPPSLWWTPLKLSSPLATSQMMMGGWLVGVAVADQERNWLLIEWEPADQNWIGDWSWFWRPAPSFQKVSNNYSFWITFCQNCLQMVVWWQRGGAAHSANEQEGRKGGKVSILTLAAFMFGFYI